MPKVSIVVAVYNRDRFLAQCLDSILAQTYTDWECIIVDDGSSDRSFEIASEYVNYDRITLCRFPHCGNLGKILKYGFEQTSGEYLAQVDSDDWLAPTALENLTQVLDNDPTVGVAYSDYLAVTETGEPIKLSRSTYIPYSKERLLVDLMCHHLRLVRRSCYEQVGGYSPRFAKNQDFDLCLKLSEITDMARFPQVLYYRRMHPDSITSSHRDEQIKYARLAIEQALSRRGLSDRSLLDVCPDTGKVELSIRS